MRSAAKAAWLTVLVACSSGGDDASSGVSIRNVTRPWEATCVSGLPLPSLVMQVSFSGDVRSLSGRTIYVGVAVPYEWYGAPNVWVEGETLWLDVPGLSMTVPPGDWSGDVLVAVCYDATCGSQLDNSPYAVPWAVHVLPGPSLSSDDVTIETTFGVPATPARVDVLTPPGTVSWDWVPDAQSTAIDVVRSGAGLDVVPRLVGAGTYVESGVVDVYVVDSSRSVAEHLPVPLRVTYTVGPDPARPVILTPAERTVEFDLAVSSGAAYYQSPPSVLEQEPGGTLEVFEFRLLSAPPEAAGHPAVSQWLARSGSSYLVRACLDDVGTPSGCLPPGTYEGAVRYRYTAASAVVSYVDQPVHMTIRPCCNGRCDVDFQASTQHCGACFDACVWSQVCAAGTCACPQGQELCGTCVDLETDLANCGACGHRCSGAQTCVGGSCCPGGLTACGASCVDLRSDPQNCGACGSACPDAPSCLDGICACPAGERACGGACVDPQNDRTNCGVCGNACAAGTVCLAGTCGCAPGTETCGLAVATCLDLQTDADNCGACGHRCAAGDGCVAGACVARSGFGMLGGDAAHTGLEPDETGVPPLSEAWRAKGAASVVIQPVTDGGRVFVLDGYPDLVVRAFEATTGAELWTHPAATVLLPAASRGLVYVGRVDAAGYHLVALDRATGQEAFEAPYESQGTTTWPPIVANDVVYMQGGYFGGLYGFDTLRAGGQLFSWPGHTYDCWSPAYYGGRVYSAEGGAVRAHDPLTGEVLATAGFPGTSVGWSTRSVPVFAGGMGYFVSAPTLYAFSPDTLATAWSLPGAFSSYPAVAAGAVYALDGGRLDALDASTGQLSWSFAGDGQLAFAPVIAAGHVYVASYWNVYAVDLATHAQVWSAPVGGPIAIGSGMLLVADYASADLVAFRLTAQ